MTDTTADDGVPPPGGWFRRARLRFRIWRRTRPFWGGLFALIGGVEILLSEKAPLPVIIHLGAQGLAGYVVPIILVLCALLLWFNPEQRVFYSIIAVLAALGSLVTSNLGGFLIGMLLGIVGGSLAFAWVPGEERKRGKRRRRAPAAEGPSAGLGLVLGDADGAEPPDGDGRDAETQQFRPDTGGSGQPGDDTEQWPDSGGPPTGGNRAHAPPGVTGGPRGNGTLLAMAPVPLMLALVAWLPGIAAAGSLPAGAAASTATPSVRLVPAATPTATPTPAATATPTPAATPTPTPTAPPTPTPTSTPSPTATPTPTPTPSPSPVHRKAAAPALLASTAQWNITAGSAVMTGLAYDGVASVPTATGAVQMLKFSMNSMTFSGGTVLTVAENGHSVVTSNSSLDFSGNVVFYTTRLSGQLLGAAVTFTPQNPPPAVLPTTTLTNLVTDQPLTAADSFQANDLRVSAS